MWPHIGNKSGFAKYMHLSVVDDLGQTQSIVIEYESQIWSFEVVSACSEVCSCFFN